MKIEAKYLVMVTTNNNNKFYKMVPNGNSVDIEYGRIGATCSKTTCPISKFNSKYNEKIKKGYVDQTELVSISKAPTEVYVKIEDESVSNIVEYLQSIAQAAIRNNYTIASHSVTQKMIDNAEKILNSLISAKTVTEFNEILIKLFAIIPRKMSNVNAFLATNDSDLGKIITAEQDLLDVMKGQVVTPSLDSEGSNVYDKTILEVMGIKMAPVDDEDIKVIKKALGEEANRYVEAWKVENSKTQEAFNSLYNGQERKLLWHGSRSENWWSIVNSGLVLRPTNAVITGKMFGMGIYFATNPTKSIGYTSLRGSYWASGSSTCAFMGLYDVIYGKPYDVHSFDSKYYSLNYDSLQKNCAGADSLHAHAGTMLKNDEIVIYKSEQATIKYLVKIK